jgi:hypothetical protein
MQNLPAATLSNTVDASRAMLRQANGVCRRSPYPVSGLL